jgi:putative oxidoreductase
MSGVIPSPLQRLAPFAPLVLRVGIGAVMAVHGLQKLTGGPAGFAEGMLAGLGVPAPLVFAWIVTLIELVGGIALILGVVTRLAALLIAGVLVGAIALVKVNVGFVVMGAIGAELDVAVLVGALALVLLGPGRLSVDHAIGIEAGDPAVHA